MYVVEGGPHAPHVSLTPGLHDSPLGRGATGMVESEGWWAGLKGAPSAMKQCI